MCRPVRAEKTAGMPAWAVAFASEHMMRTADWSRSTHVGTVCVLVSIVLTGNPLCHVAAQPPNDRAVDRAAAIVERLQGSFVEHDFERHDALSKELQDMGEAAVVAMERTMAEADSTARRALISPLIGIAGDRSTGLLLRIALIDEDLKVQSAAAAALINRPIRAELTAENVEKIQSWVRDGDFHLAGPAAGVLARCLQVPIEERAGPVVERLEREAGLVEIKPERYAWGSYLSQRVFEINQFLIAVAAIEGPVVRDALRQALEKYEEDSPVRKWLLVGLGMAEDPEIAGALLDLFLNEEDLSTKAVALRAYARSAGTNAIPILESFKDDMTGPPGNLRRPIMDRIYPLRTVARDELAHLGRLRRGQAQ